MWDISQTETSRERIIRASSDPSSSQELRELVWQEASAYLDLGEFQSVDPAPIIFSTGINKQQPRP